MFVFNSTGGSRGVSSSLWVWRGGDGSLRRRGLTGGVSAEERNRFLLLQVELLFGPVHLRHHTCPAGCLSPALNLGCNPACLHLDTMNGKESGLFSKRRNTRKKTNLWSSASRQGWGGRVKARKANSSSLGCRALCREIYLWLEGACPCQQGDLSGQHRASSNL